jgi:predicted ATPase
LGGTGTSGCAFATTPTQADIGQALQQTQGLLSGKSVESLLALSEMAAADKKAAMVMLSIAVTAAYQSAPNLLPLLIFAQVDLSLQYGNDPKSTYGYIMYGLMQVVMLRDIETGYQFGQLGMNLLQRFNHSKICCQNGIWLQCPSQIFERTRQRYPEWIAASLHLGTRNGGSGAGGAEPDVP